MKKSLSFISSVCVGPTLQDDKIIFVSKQENLIK